MPNEIKINSAEITLALTRLANASENLEPAMRDIAGVLESASDTAFAFEVDPTTGEHWAGLFPETIDQRSKKGNWPGPILQVSGALVRSITTDYGNDFAMIGTNEPHAAAHQFGAEVNNLEARPFLGISQQDENEILAILADHLSEAL